MGSSEELGGGVSLQHSLILWNTEHPSLQVTTVQASAPEGTFCNCPTFLLMAAAQLIGPVQGVQKGATPGSPGCSLYWLKPT